MYRLTILAVSENFEQEFGPLFLAMNSFKFLGLSPNAEYTASIMPVIEGVGGQVISIRFTTLGSGKSLLIKYTV